MADEYVRITGIEELKQRLKRLPAEMQKRVIRRGLGAGAQVMKKAAARFTPGGGAPYRPSTKPAQQTGTLARAPIAHFVKRASNETQAKYIVTYRKGKRFQERVTKRGRRIASSDAYYASWVEFGHRIVPRSARVRNARGRLVNTRTRRSRRAAATGRVEGRRMLTKAWLAERGRTLDAIIDGIRMNFDKAVQATK